MPRTERESDNRRREIANLLVLPRPAKNMQNSAGFSGKTSTYWARPKKKSGLSATERAVGKNVRAALAKRKRTICQKHQIMREDRVKVGKSRSFPTETSVWGPIVA